jgi:hypothetical protein
MNELIPRRNNAVNSNENSNYFVTFDGTNRCLNRIVRIYVFWVGNDNLQPFFVHDSVGSIVGGRARPVSELRTNLNLCSSMSRRMEPFLSAEAKEDHFSGHPAGCVKIDI